jgi:hypothetical protein
MALEERATGRAGVVTGTGRAGHRRRYCRPSGDGYRGRPNEVAPVGHRGSRGRSEEVQPTGGASGGGVVWSAGGGGVGQPRTMEGGGGGLGSGRRGLGMTSVSEVHVCGPDKRE